MYVTGVRRRYVFSTFTYAASSSLRRWVERFPAVIPTTSWRRGNAIWSRSPRVASATTTRRPGWGWSGGGGGCPRAPLWSSRLRPPVRAPRHHHDRHDEQAAPAGQGEYRQV